MADECRRAGRDVDVDRAWLRAMSLSPDDAAGARELLAEDGDDPELRELLRASEERLNELEEEIRLAMVEPDPNDEKDVIVEIRPGAGGEEAGLFAGDLYRMLDRYADRRGFKTEPIEVGDGHFTFAVKGQGAYSVFKYEGGTHRVQRVPETESQGRIHTSTATVAVLPEAEDVDIQINEKDLRIDTYRSSGAGGQHVNKTDSAVRLTHIPTGIVVACQNERSQHKNRAMAMKILRSRLYELELDKQKEKMDTLHKTKKDNAWGSQIRSYVLHPYRLVKDHRTNIEIGNADAVLDGDIDPFIQAYLLHDSDSPAA
jgi:peptide chain release factor 1